MTKYVDKFKLPVGENATVRFLEDHHVHYFTKPNKEGASDCGECAIGHTVEKVGLVHVIPQPSRLFRPGKTMSLKQEDIVISQLRIKEASLEALKEVVAAHIKSFDTKRARWKARYKVPTKRKHRIRK
jgi:hypothetical protein